MDKILETQHWFKFLSENSKDLVGLHDQAGKILYISKSITNLLGISPNTYINQEPYEYVYEKDIPFLQQKMEFLVKNKSVSPLEYRMLHKDKRIIWVESRVVPVTIKSSGENYYISFTTNIDERKKAEDDLESKLKLINKVQELSKIGIFKWNIKTKQVIWTDELYKIHGYSKKNGPPDFEIYLEHVHKEDREKLVRNMDQSFNKRPYSCDYRIYNIKTNELKYIHSEAIMEFDEGNKADMFIGCDQDITQRKQVENALLESEQKYRSVVETAQEMIFVIKNGIIVFANKAILQANKAKKEDVVGRNFLDFVPAVERARIIKIHQERLAARKKHLRYESKALSLTGEIRLMEISSNLITYEGTDAVLVIMHDITDRKKAELALQESEDKYRNIVELSSDGIMTFTPKGRILSINKAFLMLSGYEKEDFVGKNYLQIPTLLSQENISYGKMFKKALLSDSPDPFEFRWKHKNGEIRVTEAMPGLIKKENKPEFLQVIFRDITERKKNEQALRQSEERYRSLFENSSDPTLIIEDYTFVLCNETTVKFLGYKDKSEIEGKTLWELSPPGQPDNPSSKAKAIKMMNIAIKKGVNRFEWIHTRASGEQLWIDVALTYIPATKQIYTVWRDITARKRTQLAIDKLEESTFATFGFDFIEQSVLKLSESLSSDYTFVGRFDEVKSCIHTIAVCENGHPADNLTYDLAGTPCEKVIITGACSFPADVDLQFNEDALLGEMGVKAYVGIPLINSHKERIGLLVALFRKNLDSVDFIEKILQIYANRVASEMERMDSHRELQNSEERWRSLGENAPGNITLLDKNLIITVVNKVDPGYTKEMFLGRSVLDFYTEEERPKFKAILEEVLETGQLAYFENTNTDKNGTRWFSNHVGPLVQNGSVENLIIFSTDITGQKKDKIELDVHREHLEEMVKERAAELLLANKELEAFAYSVSHDLRAPLRHINAFSGMLRDSFSEPLNKKQQHYFDTIMAASVRMSMLIDDILLLSRIGRYQIERTQANFNGIIRDVLQEFEPDIQNRNITWDIDQLPPVLCDTHLLFQVWSNLISNAIKYTSKKDKAEIQIGFLPEKDGEITFFIRDNGAGFNPKYLDRMFGVFQRLHTSKDFEGIGIGLAIVQRIVEKHRGKIWAEGEEGKGAVFYFTMPSYKS